MSFRVVKVQAPDAEWKKNFKKSSLASTYLSLACLLGPGRLVLVLYPLALCVVATGHLRSGCEGREQNCEFTKLDLLKANDRRELRKNS